MNLVIAFILFLYLIFLMCGKLFDAFLFGHNPAHEVQ